MREIALDTETTGLSPEKGDRIIEIACVELLNHLPTGRFYHQYINPERDVPQEAFNIHGLSTEFLKSHPTFAEIVEDFIAFIGPDTPLVIHNAQFDVRFINAEFKRLGQSPLLMSRAIDTLEIAKRQFPGSPATLDALCKKFQIDNSKREKHGALLDTELLAQVYLELRGGRQQGLGILTHQDQSLEMASLHREAVALKTVRPARPHDALSEEEKAAHAAFISSLKDPLWLKG